METKNGRQTISRIFTRLLSVILVLTLTVVVSNAQIECLSVCEQNLAQCVNPGGGGGGGLTCLEIYQLCIENCIGAAGAVLG